MKEDFVFYPFEVDKIKYQTSNQVDITDLPFPSKVAGLVTTLENIIIIDLVVVCAILASVAVEKANVRVRSSK